MKSLLLIVFFCLVSVHLSNAQWVLMNNETGNVYSLVISGNNIFAGTSYGGAYLSTNNGTNWSQTSLNNQTVWSMAVNGNNIYAGTLGNSGVYLSTDNGTSWTQTSLNNLNVRSLASSGNYVFAGTESNGVFLSTNNGTSWTQTSLNNRQILSLAINGNNIFAGTYPSYGVYLSTDNGTSWTQTSLNNRQVWSLAINGNNIFAGTSAGVYLSSDNGTSWTQTSLNNRVIDALAVNGNNIIAGTYGNGVYVSTDNGTNWTQRNEGLGNLTLYSLCIINTYIIAGTGYTSTNGIFRRTLGELTGIIPISNETPNSFSLSQNYPNPFNPSTTIKFALPNNGFAKLVVYDALGRAVETLVNEQLNAGIYEVDWNASKFSSGVYFYTLTSAEGFSRTNKMLLTK